MYSITLSRTTSILSCVACLAGTIFAPAPIIGTTYAQKSIGANTATLSTPKSEVEQTLQEILVVVEKYPNEDQISTRRAKLREVINPRFDFKEMSQRCLGTFWRDITPAQQQDFVTTFSELLARTYLGKIELVKRDTVKINSEEVQEPKALVRTTIFYKGDKFPLDYKLMLRDGKWQVYDVVIENIGLIANYRNEFAGIIRKDGFDGLMTQLKEKNAKFAQ